MLDDVVVGLIAEIEIEGPVATFDVGRRGAMMDFRLRCASLALASCVSIFTIATGSNAFAAEQKASSDKPVMFDISARPLADALVAYGAATGLEVYYDGGLALGRSSAPVVGSFTPLHGLEILLEGTGYWPRTTSPDTFTLVSVQQADLPARVNQSQLRKHEPYFAALQVGIAKALCGVDADFGKRIIFSFWVTGTGAIYRAEVLGSDKSASGNMAIVDRINRVNIGRPPPAEVRQPITMAVYPPTDEDTPACSPAAKREAGR